MYFAVINSFLGSFGSSRQKYDQIYNHSILLKSDKIFHLFSVLKKLTCHNALTIGHECNCQLMGRMSHYQRNCDLHLSKTAAKLSSGFMSTLFSTIMVQSVIDMNLIDVNSSLDRIAVVMRNVVLILVCSAHVVKLMT